MIGFSRALPFCTTITFSMPAKVTIALLGTVTAILASLVTISALANEPGPQAAVVSHVSFNHQHAVLLRDHRTQVA